MKLPIYLDYAATTPLDPRVAEKMQRYLTLDGCFGNPSSVNHVYGLEAKKAVELAREQAADLIHAEPTEIIWTSCATESINLALKGAAQLYQRQGKHIITLKTEHKAVLDTCQQLEKEGYAITYLTPETNGLINLDQFKHAIRQDTILVSIMHVNNEIGVIQNLQALTDETFPRHILFHVDASQSIGKIPIDVRSLPIDLMSFCAHKIYGPKGIGALYIRRKPRVRVAPQMHGGGQEQGMRSGTLATHQIVGMGEALHLAKLEMVKDQDKIQQLRARLWQGIQAYPGVYMNPQTVAADTVLPNILNLCFPRYKAEALMQALPDLAISAGSACTSKGSSYVLRALGLSDEQAASAVRFSFGRFTTFSEIDFAAEKIRGLL